VTGTGEGSPFIGQVLDRAFSQAKAVVVLITGDDIARLNPSFWSNADPPHEKELNPQARPNVLFEAGMAFGRHPERTILVSLGYSRPFSDVAGRNTAPWFALKHGPAAVESAQVHRRPRGIISRTCGGDREGLYRGRQPLPRRA
jgi:Predicted nucleotide-binding protein containing TIR-like domain